MTTIRDLEDEINHSLADLHQDVSARRDAKKNPSEIQRTMDKFVYDWCGRLDEEREAILKRNHQAIDASHEELGPGTSVEHERDRARKVVAEVETTEPELKNQLRELRDGMIQGVVDIQHDRKPTPVNVLDAKKEQARQDQEIMMGMILQFEGQHQPQQERDVDDGNKPKGPAGR